MREKLTPSKIATMIETVLPVLSSKFETRDLFYLINNISHTQRAYIAAALRQLQRKGIVRHIGYGSHQVCIWRKQKQPAPPLAEPGKVRQKLFGWQRHIPAYNEVEKTDSLHNGVRTVASMEEL